MIMGLVKQLPIKMLITQMMSQYISKNVKVMENKIIEKVNDVQYKQLYEQQLQFNEQQMKFNQQILTIQKFILVMLGLILACEIIRMFY